MRIECPSCGSGMILTGVNPGRYKPTCPTCRKPFLVAVPADAAGAIVVRPTTDTGAALRGAVGRPRPAAPRPAPRPARRPAPPAVARYDAGDFNDPEDEEYDQASAADPPPEEEYERTSVVGSHQDGEERTAVEGDDPEEDFSVDPKAEGDKGSPAEADEDEDFPDRLGGYEVLKVLGKGGMGAVLLGRQISLDRRVALKVMHPRVAKHPGFVARFTREAYAAAQLTHHNVVQIYDIGEDDGQHFFSMEFVGGKTLGELVKAEGKLTPDLAVGYILQAARGLRYGHLQGMVHRDIKPDNLMINTEGIVKVADLGLVKLPAGSPGQRIEDSLVDSEGLTDASRSELTGAGAVMGTPAYMPPEQARDSGSVDQRADVYSLGCTLYVLITGRPPFAGKTAVEIMSKHQTEPIVPPEVVVKRVPKALSAILLRMLAKKPEDRYQSMDQVIAALEGFLGVDRAGPLNPTERQADQLEKCANEFNARSKGGAKGMLASVFVLACVAGLVGSAFAGRPVLAAGLLGVVLMTPAAYFVTHGMLSGGVVFRRVRALVAGMRVIDWLIALGGAALFLVTLFLFGLLVTWLGFAVVAVGCGFLLWVLTDSVQEQAQKKPLDEARALFRTMRLAGFEEEALRQFVCKFSGANWEPFFEALFGYEAKLAARAYRKGNTGEVSKTAGTWREPVVGWIDARLETRRLAREEKHLRDVEAKALEAEGVSKADARERAEIMAAVLVDQAVEASQARKAGKEASIKAMLASARSRRPPPGYNIAGVKLRKVWLKHFLNDWVGMRLRFVLGAVVFAAGLLWMHQNGLMTKQNGVLKAVTALDYKKALKELDGPALPGERGEDRAAAGPDEEPAPGNTEYREPESEPTSGFEEKASASTPTGQVSQGGRPVKTLTVKFLPRRLTELVNSYTIPLTGLLLMLSGIFYFGWQPSCSAIPGALIGVVGPAAGVPGIGPLGPHLASFVIAAILIVVVSRFLRD